MQRTFGGHMAHSTYTTKHAIRRLLLYNVYQNHAKKQTLGGHMTHSTHTTKHAIRRLLLYIVYQNHAKNVWRTHDPFDLHTETQTNPINLWHMVHQSHAKKMLVDPLPTRPPQTKCKTQISKVENKPVIGPQPRQEGRARNQARTVVPGVPTQL